MGTWIGSKRVAVLPCDARHPGIAALPANFRDVIQRRVHFDPDPATGVDRSLRRYVHTVSYGRAVLDADVLDTVTIDWHQNPQNPDPTVNAQVANAHNEAIRLAGPAVENYEFVLVVFPALSLNAHAFFDARTAYMFFGTPIGVWAHELIHITTGFGDLYHPPAGRPLTPGNLDEMDTAGAMHPSTFTKLSIGWLDADAVRVVDLGQGPSTHTLHSLALLQPPPPDRSTALRIPLADRQNHYLLVESREWLDDYDRNTPRLSEGVPLEGVAVYDVDEAVWSPLWLKAQGLASGEFYLDDLQRFRIDVGDRLVGGGFQLTFRPLPAPQRCAAIKAEIEALKGEIRDLQSQLDEPGADKPGLIRQIKALQDQISRLKQEAAALNCAGWTDARMGILGQAPDDVMAFKKRRYTGTSS